MHRQAARKEADRQEDRRTQDLSRFRTSGALTDVEHIRDDEDRKNRHFGADQAVHPHAATEIARGTHSYFQSGSSGCFRSQRGRRLMTVGTSPKLYSGGGDEVSHSSVQASHGSSPACSPDSHEISRFSMNT